MPSYSKLVVNIGDKYNKLTVIDFVERRNYMPIWRFRCDCGNIKLVNIYNAISGRVKSCGCLRKFFSKETKTRHGASTKEGRHLEYIAWSHMKERCHNVLCPDYHNYGGRGITVCETWKVYENFLTDMGKKPCKSYSLERIDVNGNYEPTNCRWASWGNQARNRRNTKMVNIAGIWEPIATVAERMGITNRTVVYRNRQNIKSLGDLLKENPNLFKK